MLPVPSFFTNSLFSAIVALIVTSAPTYAGSVTKLSMHFDGLTVRAFDLNGAKASSFDANFTGLIVLNGSSLSNGAIGVNQGGIRAIGASEFGLAGQLRFDAGTLTSGLVSITQPGTLPSFLNLFVQAPSAGEASPLKMSGNGIKQFKTSTDALSITSIGSTSYFGTDLSPWVNQPTAFARLDVSSLMRPRGLMASNGVASMSENSGSLAIYSTAVVPLPIAAWGGAAVLGAIALRKRMRSGLIRV